MVESTAKLRAEIMALSGVDIMELDGKTFKSTYKILDELAAKWQDLTDIQQASVTELIAGKRQGNVVSSLMTNFDTAREALEKSVDSEGSAMTEHEKWMQSIEASVNRVKAAWQSFSQAFLKSDFLKGLLKVVESLASGAGKLFDSFGTLPTLAALFMGGRTLFTGKGFSQPLINEATGAAEDITTSFGQAARTARQSLESINVEKGFTKTFSQNDITALQNYTKAMNNGATHAEAFEQHMTDAGVAVKAYAQDQNVAVKSVDDFYASQQTANVATMAQSKSLGTARVLMKEYHSATEATGYQCKLTGMNQTAFKDAVQQTNPALAQAMTSSKSAAGGMISYTTSLVAAKAATFALKVTTMAFNMALTMGVGWAVSEIISLVSDWINADEKLAETVDELTSKYKEQHKALVELKKDFDTSNEESMISKYQRLSRGVDGLGRNVSLTTDEYEEYQGIVNKIADNIPSLVQGYNSQGDAILSCKDNVEELTLAYEKLIHAQNQQILINTGNLEEDFENTLDDNSGDGWWANGHGFWTGLLGGGMIPTIVTGSPATPFVDYDLKEDTVENLKKLLDAKSKEEREKIYEAIAEDPYSSQEIRTMLQDFGVDVSSWDDADDIAAQLESTLEKDYPKIQGAIDNFYAQFADDVEKRKQIAQSVLSEAFDVRSSISGLEYKNIDENLQEVARQIVGSLDYQFFKDLKESGKTVEQWTKDLLTQLNNIGGDSNAKIETGLDLRTQFNGGEISFGEYVEELENVGLYVQNLEGVDDNIKKQIMLTLGLNEDGLVEQYQNLKNRLLDDEHFDVTMLEYEDILNNLSAEELAVLDVTVLPRLKKTEYKETVADIKNELERELLIQGLYLDLNIEAETEGIDALNTALKESVSATGLSAESINALKSRYKDLGGFNAAKLFEETANGIRLNSDELQKLESEYKNLNKQEIDETLEKLVGEYNELTAEIEDCSDASRRADLYAQRESIIDQINDTATLAAQYKGLTFAFKEWQSAQEAGQDRDQYESIISGRTEIEEEMHLGWLDDAAVEYLELLSGKELSTAGIDAQIAAYKELNHTISGTKYSVWDFFTQNEDGEATSDGVYNFFNAVKDVTNGAAAWIDKNGKYNLDFEGFEYNGKTGDAAIAEILGTSEELVQIILKASEDAGFVVNIKGEYTDLANLKNEAETANDRMKELGATTYTFDFDSTDLDNLNEQITEAEKALGNLKNEDGTLKVGVSEEDYRQAQNIISALIYQKQRLDDSAILHVDTSKAESDIEIAISKLQEFKQYTNTLEFQTAIGADTSEVTTNIQSALDYINGLSPEIKAGLGLDMEDVNAAIGSIQADIKAGVAIKQEDIDVVNAAISSISNDAMITLGLDETLIDNYKATEQTAKGTVNWDSNIEKVTAWINQTHEASGTVNWANNTTDVKTTFFGNGYINWTVSEANGTANVNGTAFNHGAAEKSGKAFRHGDWGIDGSGTALGGELGAEILVRDGRWYTIGDSGAEFFNYKKGDIIFNHRQTEELLANGKVTSGGGRGRALSSGTALAEGSGATGGISRPIVNAVKYFSDTVKKGLKKAEEAKRRKEEEARRGSEEEKKQYKETGRTTVGSDASNGDPDAIKDAVKDGSGEAEKFEETIDFIEIKIARIEQIIDDLDQKTNNVYISWGKRNNALADQIGKVGEEIEIQKAAADRYLKEANDVGLSETWASRVRNGTIDIYDENDFDEETAEKIKEYQEWYEKALDCKSAVEELKEEEAKLYAQRLDHVIDQYDGILGVIEHEKNILDEYISQSEANAQLVSAEYYNALVANEKNNLSQLQVEKTALLSEMQAVMASGKIEEGSESWYDLCSKIDDVTLSIAESQTQLLEYQQTIQQLSWETFDLLQEKISAITEESEFLIELMSSDKLYSDKGQLTDSGMATMGLHGQNYNVSMYQADQAAAEAARLKKELAKDPFDTELEERYREMVALQQEHILAAQDEKNAIRDMVEEGIELELDALQELIDKKNEALESEKDLYDYQKKVKEQTEEIASLEKQMASYSGDDSEEAKAKIQELKVSLEDAKSSLEESEYDRYVSDQKQLLDDLYIEYEEVLNMRLDNLDALVSDMIAEVNLSASTISGTISEKAESVGYTLSESMTQIWDSNSTKINGVITTYGDKFFSAQTTTNNALNAINTNLQNMITQLNVLAKTNVKSASTSSATNSKESKPPKEADKNTTNQTTAPTIKVGGKINAKGAQIYDYAGDKSGETQYFKNDPVYKVLKTEGNWLQVRWHKLSKGITGWFKKGDVKALATGAKKIDSNDMAWTQEKGEEYIVRPSDGAILTPVAKGDSVLNATASSNIWKMANSPAEFIKDNLKLNAANVPNNSNIQNNYTQHLEKVVFNLPNVKNYDEMLSAMQHDKNFERLILSMSIDRLAGKSGLAKGKSIR